MRSFVKMKSSRNCENTLSTTDIGKSYPSRHYKHNTPVVQRKEESDGPNRNIAVKVLPTNTLALLTKTSDDTESYTPVAKPRRKKRASDVQETSLTENSGSKETNVVTNHSPVTSTKSNNSSHHYFVLEPHLV